MKKLIVAIAFAGFATAANAAIANSAHDFMTNGYVNPAPATTCIFCHTAHNATSSAAPLWVRALTNASTFYAGNTSVQPRGVQTCLSCHATGTAASMGTTGDMATLNPAAIVGADLSNDHPVGNNTIVHPGTTGFQTTITLGGVEVTDGTEMACTTCHSVHNDTGSGVKLLKATTATDFCVACHNK